MRGLAYTETLTTNSTARATISLVFSVHIITSSTEYRVCIALYVYVWDLDMGCITEIEYIKNTYLNTNIIGHISTRKRSFPSLMKKKEKDQYSNTSL